MKRQIRLGLSALALTAFLTGLALPGLAGAEVRVNVGAVEYNDSFIVVSVLAISSTPRPNLDAWELTTVIVGGVPQDLSTANVEDHSFQLLRSKLWVVKITSTNPIDINETVTAVVDLGGTSGTEEDTATCGRGLPRLQITAICK